MSFIDMMANDVWSDADITARTEAMVRAQVSVADELVLNRKIQGAALGQYTLTPEDEAQMALLAQAGFAAQQEGRAARYDMLVLNEVFEVEKAEKRLALPLVEPILDEEGNVTNQDDIDADEAERAIALERIDVADEEVMGWVDLRRPVEAPVEDPAADPIPES